MEMESQPTCGQGLAEHSVLPAKVGEWAASVAENLEVHMEALDLKDESSRKEYDAYQALAAEYRSIAVQLQATARHMAGYRGLPMGRHDQEKMTAAGAMDTFERFVKVERELVALLLERVEKDRQMLVQVGGGNSGAS
jgi:hypothetical protein